MKLRKRTLTTILLLLAAVAGVCVFVLVPGFVDSAGILLAGVVGYYAVLQQGERVLRLMGKAIRRSTPIIFRIPTVRHTLLWSFRSIGLPTVDTGLIMARATPCNAPPAFIRLF